jgi:hypothetical protein
MRGRGGAFLSCPWNPRLIQDSGPGLRAELSGRLDGGRCRRGRGWRRKRGRCRRGRGRRSDGRMWRRRRDWLGFAALVGRLSPRRLLRLGASVSGHLGIGASVLRAGPSALLPLVAPLGLGRRRSRHAGWTRRSQPDVGRERRRLGRREQSRQDRDRRDHGDDDGGDPQRGLAVDPLALHASYKPAPPVEAPIR